MISALILLGFGLLFIFLEFYLPGAILGAIGGILVAVSVVVFAMEAPPVATVLYFFSVAILLFLLIRYTLRKIPRTKPEYSIYSNSDQEGYRASKFDRSAIGKIGVVVADLKPGGYIVIDGKKHQAISQSGYIARGEQVLVLAGQEESLIVRKNNPKERTDESH